MVYRQRKRNVLAGVSLALIILIIIGIISYRTIHKNQQEVSWQKQTYDNLESIKAFQANINGAETGSRGYVITGDSSYLFAFDKYKISNDSILAKLIDRTKNNQIEQASYKDLQQLSNKRFGRLALVQQTASKEGFKNAQYLINQGIGKRLMDSINIITNNIVAKERASLQSMEESSAKTARIVFFTIIAGTLISVGLIIAMFFLLVEQISRTQKSEQNIRKAKEAEEILSDKLLQQNTQLQEFAYIISHNLKAPVNNLNALLDMHLTKENPADREFVFQKIEAESRNLKSILNQLLEALKVKQNVNKRKEKISFEEVFFRVKELLSQQITELDARLNADFSKAPYINYPRPYLENIFLNLLSNALKHHQPGRKPTIKIETENEKGIIVLKIQDNGQGINLDKYGYRIFSLNKSPLENNNKESGISLFMTKTQVEALGGEIKAESEPGEGTTFIVYFNTSKS
ncbi:MAG: hypothetical protein EOP53_13295 [Sphingobacteriales bacterium]|nr:MAG: hypothetical protein EOP53_13295 [Sphingobacteriales bacterium]